MKKICSIVVLLAITGSSGCAALRGSQQPDPAAEVEAGLALLAAGDFAAAGERLYPVYRAHWERPIGQRALLALMAAEIDPRNPDRRLWSTADMASRYLQIENVSEWTVPVAQSFYLLAVELGAAEERVARAEAERDEAEAAAARQRAAAQRSSPAPAPASRAPEFTGQTVPARLGAVQAERDELRRRVQQLEGQVTQRDRQLREREQELERIRRTIRG
jgi:hypothetical protein